MRRFMDSRLGLDEIGVVLAGAGIAAQVVANAGGWLWLSWVAVGLWLVAVMRAFTPVAPGDPAAREVRERTARTASKMWAERKEKRHFRCKGCGTILSVPRGAGKVRITCPKCGATMEKRA